MARKKTDPLLAALIAKLPPAGNEWPVDRQLAWLNLMAMAFGTVYGGNTVECFTAKAAPAAAAPPKPMNPPEHRFVIDDEGFVRRGNGQRILPKDIDAEVFDERGQDGDLREIIWADGSTGLNGADIIIRA